MRIKNRFASIAYKVALIIIGCLALAEQIGLFAGAFRVSFFFYFTNLSNLAAVAYFVGATIRLALPSNAPRSADVWLPAWKYAATMGVVVTWLVSHFLMGGGGAFGADGIYPAVLALHYLVPIMVLLDWLLFDSKGHMSTAGPFIWMVFPLAYFCYVLFMINGLGVNMHGFGTGRYPYPFIDLDQLGLWVVATNALGMLAAFIALGYLFVAIDHLLALIDRKRLEKLA